MHEMLRRAQRDGYAVPCFAHWDLISLKVIIDAAYRECSSEMLCIPDKERWKHMAHDPYVSAARIAMTIHLPRASL